MNKNTKTLSFAVAMFAIAGMTGAFSNQAYANDVAEGCSSGHWKNDARKNPAGTGDWAATGLNPDVVLLNSFFTGSLPELNVKDTNKWPLLGSAADPTLTDAASAKGSNENALAREIVAAIANIANPDVNYPLTQAELVTIVDAAILLDSDAGYNAARDALFTFNHLGEETLCPSDPT